jgi:hypothetical protein
MKTMYITEGEIHAQVNLTDEEYKELQRLIELEMNPISEDKMPKLILQAVKNLKNQFHKESSERCMKKLEEQKKLSLNSTEEAKNYKELLQKRLLKLQTALSSKAIIYEDYTPYGASEIWNLRQEIYHTISILRTVKEPYWILSEKTGKWTLTVSK